MTQDGDAITGMVVTEGDVTWKYGLYLLIEWLAAGVDMDSTVVTLVTSVARDNKARFFIVTDEFKALVTEWIDVTIPNYKFIFKQAKEETSVAVAGVHQFVHMVSDKNPTAALIY